MSDLGWAAQGKMARRSRVLLAETNEKGGSDVLLLGMIVLGLVTFGVMWAFIDLCDRV